MRSAWIDLPFLKTTSPFSVSTLSQLYGGVLVEMQYRMVRNGLHVINVDIAWRSWPFRRGSRFEKCCMHILSVEHVVNIAPLFLVIVEIVVVQDTSSLPISHDKVHEDHRLHVWNIDLPLSQPLGTVGSTRDRRADFYVKVSAFVYIH